ncbi:MAG: hypothetical protein ACLQBA_10155, partial [Candidatus Binataceae bacterium]
VIGPFPIFSANDIRPLYGALSRRPVGRRRCSVGLKAGCGYRRAGHAFQYEAGHLFQSEAGRGSRFEAGHLQFLPQVKIEDVSPFLIGQERIDFAKAAFEGFHLPDRSDRHCG